MTREEILKKINLLEEIKIYKHYEYIKAKIEMGEESLPAQVAKNEWLEIIEELKYYLDLATKQKF